MHKYLSFILISSSTLLIAVPGMIRRSISVIPNNPVWMATASAFQDQFNGLSSFQSHKQTINGLYVHAIAILAYFSYSYFITWIDFVLRLIACRNGYICVFFYIILLLWTCTLFAHAQPISAKEFKPWLIIAFWIYIFFPANKKNAQILEKNKTYHRNNKLKNRVVHRWHGIA